MLDDVRSGQRVEHRQALPRRLAGTLIGAGGVASATYLTLFKLVKDAGLSHLKLHGLRHINISLQLDAGVSETIIAMRVGHTSPALIRSTYGHLVGTVGRRAAEATAALVPRRLKQAS